VTEKPNLKQGAVDFIPSGPPQTGAFTAAITTLCQSFQRRSSDFVRSTFFAPEHERTDNSVD